jgi:hypothetical protein
MHRPRLALGFLLAPIVFTLVFFTFACGGGGPEKAILDNFFRASKMRDNSTLNNIATVSFDPRTDGQMESFSVTNVSEEQVQPLQLKELAKAHEVAKLADDEFTKKKLAYQDQHAEELKALLEAEKKGQPVKGKAAEFKASWDKWREDTKTSSHAAAVALEKLNAERGIADISVFNPQNPVDPTQYDGEVATKTYTIAAKILTPDGKHIDKTLALTLQQARLKGDKPITGKWIITKIQDQPASGTTS